MAGELYNALQRQGNLANVWQNIYGLVLGKKLKKFQEKLGKDKYAPVPETGVDTEGKSVPDVVPDVTGIPDKNIRGQEEKKIYDPTLAQPSAGGETGATDNGPGFIPIVRSTRTPPVKQTTQKPGKTDYSGLKMVSSSVPTDINEKIKQDLQEFIAYASPFGVVGQQKIQEAMNIASLNLQKPFEEGNIVNKNGVATRMLFDPGSGKTLFRPMTDDTGQPMKYFDLFPEKEFEQKIKEKTLKPTLTPVRMPQPDGTSLLGFMNMDDFTIKMPETAVNWEDYNANPLAYDKLTQQMELLQMKLEAKESGKKTGTSGISTGDIAPLLYNGKPLTYETAKDFGIPVDVMKNYYSGNAKLMKKAINQLTVYGDKITFGTTGTQVRTQTPTAPGSFNAEDWKKLFLTQYKRAKDVTDPLNTQAIQWLRDPKNIEYAKSLGLK